MPRPRQTLVAVVLTGAVIGTKTKCCREEAPKSLIHVRAWEERAGSGGRGKRGRLMALGTETCSLCT